MAKPDTASQLLDHAQRMIQERGYNAFSYKDLAEVIGIRTASIHYHFQAKADLGSALMRRYNAQLDAALEQIDRKARTAQGKLKQFIDLYRITESQGAICLCGSMASDLETLDDTTQDLVRTYLERSETWLSEVIRSGQQAGEWAGRGRPREVAASLVASLQGGLLLARSQARSQGRPQMVDQIQRTFLAALKA